MKKLLVPTDFSETAEKALRYALDIASKSGGVVHLLHVYTSIDSPFIESEQFRDEHNEKVAADGMLALEAVKTKIQEKYANVPIEIHLARTPLEDSVMYFAKENEVELIVMGTQGASGLRKAVIGTHAATVLAGTTLPLLLVPERFEGEVPAHILMMTSYQEADKKALQLVRGLIELFDSVVTLVHLAEEGEDSLEEERLKLDQYGQNLGSVLNTPELKTRVVNCDSIPDAMEGLASSVPHDLLVMAKRKRNLLERMFSESFTKHMSYLTTHPLLVIPE